MNSLDLGTSDLERENDELSSDPECKNWNQIHAKMPRHHHEERRKTESENFGEDIVAQEAGAKGSCRPICGARSTRGIRGRYAGTKEIEESISIDVV